MKSTDGNRSCCRLPVSLFNIYTGQGNEYYVSVSVCLHRVKNHFTWAIHSRPSEVGTVSVALSIYAMNFSQGYSGDSVAQAS